MWSPIEELEAIVRLGPHPAIGHGEIADSACLQHTVDFREVLVLRRCVSDMLDDMVADDDVEIPVRER